MLSLLLVSSAAAVISSSASAALPYRFGVVDFGGIPGGTVGQPITWSGPGDNRALSIGSGSLFPPSSDLIDGVPRARWDDYFMMDPLGQSVGGDAGLPGDGYSATGPTYSIGLRFESGMAFGVGAVVGSDGVGGSPASTDGRFYLMNVTLREGSSAPTTAGIYASIFAEGGGPNIDATGTAFPALRFGIQNATNRGLDIDNGQPKTSLRYYYLDYIATQVPASELPSSFGAGINYQIFVAQTDVPAPGASVVVLSACGWAARRQRR